MASLLPRNDASREALVQALCEAHGDLLEACKLARVNYRQVCLWRDADPETAAVLRDAQMMGWATLENAAYKRAVEGVDRDVYYQGEVVGTEKHYSDGLLTQMLKARVPAYSSDDGAASRSMTVNVAIMPRADSYEQWVQQREKMLMPTASIADDRQVPASQTILDYKPKSKLRDVL
jgi:hypothetical protein